jgi:peptidoglycan hydrolase-like protein with peptidoglycan-binding domain
MNKKFVSVARGLALLALFLTLGVGTAQAATIIGSPTVTAGTPTDLTPQISSIRSYQSGHHVAGSIYAGRYMLVGTKWFSFKNASVKVGDTVYSNLNCSSNTDSNMVPFPFNQQEWGPETDCLIPVLIGEDTGIFSVAVINSAGVSSSPVSVNIVPPPVASFTFVNPTQGKVYPSGSNSISLDWKTEGIESNSAVSLEICNVLYPTQCSYVGPVRATNGAYSSTENLKAGNYYAQATISDLKPLLVAKSGVFTVLPPVVKLPSTNKIITGVQGFDASAPAEKQYTDGIVNLDTWLVAYGSFGSDPAVTVDGLPVFPAYKGERQLNIDLKYIAAGSHTLGVKVKNVSGVYSSETASFSIVKPAVATSVTSSASSIAPVVSTITGTVVGDTNLSDNISLGSKGDDVKALQQYLKTNGFSSAKPDGVFGKKTLVSLKKFQSKIGLAPDGTIDPTDWQIIDKNPIVIDPVGVSAAAFASGASGPVAQVNAIASLPPYTEIPYSPVGLSRSLGVKNYENWINFINTGVDKIRDTQSIQSAQKAFTKVTTLMWSTQGLSLENVEANHAGAYNAIVRLFNSVPFILESSRADQWEWTKKTYLSQVENWKSTWTPVIQEKLDSMKISQDAAGNRTGETGGDWGKVVVDKSGKLVSAELSTNGSVPPSVISAIVSRPESQVFVAGSPAVPVTASLSIVGITARNLVVTSSDSIKPFTLKWKGTGAGPFGLSSFATATDTSTGDVNKCLASMNDSGLSLGSDKRVTSEGTITMTPTQKLASGCTYIFDFEAKVGSSSNDTSDSVMVVVQDDQNTWSAPTISSIYGLDQVTSQLSTAPGIGAAGKSLSIRGTNFGTPTVVKMNTQVVVSTLISSTQINALIPFTLSGQVTVTVANPGLTPASASVAILPGSPDTTACAISEFKAATSTILTSQPVVLSWSTSGCASVSVSNASMVIGGSSPLTGSVTVNPVATTTYTLTAKDSKGVTKTATTTITVGSEPVVFPVITAVKGLNSSTNNYTDNTGVAGQFLVIGSNNTFSTSGNIVKINGQAVDALYQSANQINVKIPATYTSGSYAVTVTNSKGFQSQVWNVQISGVATVSDCSITSFTSGTITATTSPILSWYVSAGCVSVSISNLGTVNNIGSLAVSPTATTTYTLTAKSASGVVVTKDAVVTIGGLATTKPVISSIQGYDAVKNTYTTGTVASGQTLVLYGSFDASGNNVSVNGSPVATSYQSTTQINVPLNSAPAGSGIVSVYNSKGASNVFSFTITAAPAGTVVPPVTGLDIFKSPLASTITCSGTAPVCNSTANSCGKITTGRQVCTNGTWSGCDAQTPPATTCTVPVCGSYPTPLCTSGTATSANLDTVAKKYVWSCGNGSTTTTGTAIGQVSCSQAYLGATNGACGLATNTEAPYSLSGVGDNSYFCYTGTKASLSQKSDGTYSWYCNGSAASTGVNAGSSVICANKTASGTSSDIPTTLAAPAAPVATNGVCGGAVNVWSPQVPTSNFCSAGTASATTPNADGTYSWTCAGVGAGAVTVSCQNTKSPYTVAPSAKSKVAAAASKLKSAASTKLKSAFSIFKKNKTKEDQTATAGTSVKN